MHMVVIPLIICMCVLLITRTVPYKPLSAFLTYHFKVLSVYLLYRIVIMYKLHASTLQEGGRRRTLATPSEQASKYISRRQPTATTPTEPG